MKIENTPKLIKTTTFLKSVITHSSFIFSIIYVMKFFDVQKRFHSHFSLAIEVMKLLNNSHTHREKLVL